MDSNKDEALRCITIARAALDGGDKERAQRFLLKAKRLFPDADVGDLLSTTHEDVGKQVGDNELATEGICGGPDKGHAGAVPLENDNSNSFRQRRPSTTSEQAKIVRHIRGTTDYYELLGLGRDCSEDEVRKAYKKISLKVHPDKNKSAGAEDAFKAVSKAFNCLSNSELRKKYDREGVDETCENPYNQNMRQNKAYGFYYGTSEPDEYFANFFFGMNQPDASFQRTHFFRTPRRGGREESGVDGERSRELHFVGLIKLLAVLVIVFLNFMPNSQPLYSLQREGSYQYEHLTKSHRVTFFVKNADFVEKYPPDSYNRKNVEISVERDYRDILAHNCRVEVRLRMWGQTEETPNCDALQQFQHAA